MTDGLLSVLQLVARSKEDILKARGVKPTLSPNLNTLATIEALDVKRLLFVGVGCQVRPAVIHSRIQNLFIIPESKIYLSSLTCGKGKDTLLGAISW